MKYVSSDGGDNNIGNLALDFTFIDNNVEPKGENPNRTENLR